MGAVTDLRVTPCSAIARAEHGVDSPTAACHARRVRIPSLCSTWPCTYASLPSS